MSAAPSPGFPRRRRRWIASAVVGGVLVLLSLVSAPEAIRYALKQWFLSRGAESVTISDVDFNPFTGRVRLDAAAVLREGEARLVLKDALLDVEWAPAFRRRLSVAEFRATGLDLTVRRLPEGEWRLGGVVAAVIGDEESEENEARARWGIGLDRFELRDSRLRLDLPRGSVLLEVDRLSIEKVLSWDAETAGRFELLGRLNGAALEFEGLVRPFAAVRTGEAAVTLKGLALDPLLPLLGAGPESLGGRVSIDVRLQARQGKAGNLLLRHEGNIDLEALELVLEGAELEATELGWNGRMEIQLASGAPHRLELAGDLSGAGTRVTTPDMRVTQEGIRWEGEAATATQAGRTEITLRSDALTLVTGSLVHPAVSSTQESLVWKGAVDLSLRQGTGYRLEASGELNQGPSDLALPGQGLKVRQGGIAWKGALQVSAEDGRTTTGVQSDALTLAASSVEGPGLRSSHGQTSWRGTTDLSVRRDGGYALEAQGELDHGPIRLALTEGGLDQRQAKLRWKGRTRVKGGAQGVAAPEVIVEGRATATGLEVSEKSTGLGLVNRSVSWTGRAAYQADGVRGGVSASGKASIGATSLRKDPAGLELVSLDSLELSDLELSQSGTLAVSRATAAGVLVGRFTREETVGARALATSPEVSLEGLALGPESRDLGVVRAQDVVAFVHRDRAGEWPVIDALVDALASAARGREPVPTTRVEDDESAPAMTGPDPLEGDVPLRLDALELGGDSRVELLDEGVNPPYKETLRLKALRLGAVDSARPDQTGDLVLSMELGRHTRAEATGEVQPFAERATLSVDGKLRELALPPFSPYLERMLGWSFTSGELDADLKLGIVRGVMDGETRLVFHKMELSQGAEETDETLGMPVQTALSLVRDKDGNIRLTVPISGDLNDPKVGLGDAINQALARATRRSALTYLKFAIQPFGAALVAAEVAGARARAIRLDPIGFEAGSDQLSEVATAYLGKIVQVMRERPEVQLRVCGYATEGDRDALQRVEDMGPRPTSGAQDRARAPSPITDGELLDLAKARAVRVEDYLTAQAGIGSERLVQCKASVEDDTEPRVVILI